MTLPFLAVVGQPNKGKSSIVATLAEDDRVLIAATPGTTRSAAQYRFSVNGETLYVLIDTPGFQRAAETLAWLEAVPVAADARAARVAEFVDHHRDNPRFHDECELLAPIVEGAGVVYVVDGSKPYGEEYEVEMQILRWTGRPRAALINTIGEGDYTLEWRRALDQYFSIVRVFDAANADYPQRLDLLRALAMVSDDWRANLEAAVAAMTLERTARRTRAAEVIAACVADLVTLTVSARLTDSSERQTLEARLVQRLQDNLRARERRARDQVQAIYWHESVQRSEPEVPVLREDLFTADGWAVFGLSRTQLLVTGAISGAVAGGGIDLVTGGASMLLGSGIGALIGGTGAWLGGRRLARVEILGQPLGGDELRVGPVSAPNFPWVLLGRAWIHFAVVSERNHARRDAINLEVEQSNALMDAVPTDLRREIDRALSDLKADRSGANALARLTTAVEALLGTNATA